MKKTTLLLLFFSLTFSVFSEMRVWKDKAGKTYEAEYVRELFDKLTLKTAGGKEIRLPVKDFSEHDQKYLRVMVPPNLEIDFSKKTSIKPKPIEMFDQDNDTVTILSTTVKIIKDSKRPFTSGLKAELFLIAEEVAETQYKILLTKTDRSFLLPEEKGDSYEFKTKPIELQVYTEYDESSRRGPVFVGYFIVVTDKQGNVVQEKTDVLWLEGKGQELRLLYQNGAGSRYSRYFDKKTIKKVKVPRVTGSFPRN